MALARVVQVRTAGSIGRSGPVRGRSLAESGAFLACDPGAHHRVDPWGGCGRGTVIPAGASTIIGGGGPGGTARAPRRRQNVPPVAHLVLLQPAPAAFA